MYFAQNNEKKTKENWDALSGWGWNQGWWKNVQAR